MAFHDVQFPTAISINAVGGPRFKTSIFFTGSGHEKRNIDWELQRGEWDVAPAIHTPALFTAARDFFYGRRGMAHTFRFQDPGDYTLARQQVGTGDGATVDFQIYKRYDSTNPYDRNLTKPQNGTLQVWKDSVLQTETTHYTVDYATGIITFNSAPAASPAAVIEAACQFDCHARFDTDHMATQFEFKDFQRWEVPIVEVKE